MKGAEPKGSVRRYSRSWSPREGELNFGRSSLVHTVLQLILNIFRCPQIRPELALLLICAGESTEGTLLGAQKAGAVGIAASHVGGGRVGLAGDADGSATRIAQFGKTAVRRIAETGAHSEMGERNRQSETDQRNTYLLMPDTHLIFPQLP